AVFFGISMGGMIAQEIALRHPQRTRAVILGCTLPGGWEKAVRVPHAADVFTAFSLDPHLPPDRRAAALSRVAFAPGFIEKHPEAIRMLNDSRRCQPLDPTGLKARLEAVDSYNAFARLKEIRCPALIITGKNDQLVDHRNS